MLTSTDRYRHQHTRLKGEIIKFKVQYEIKVERDWFPVIRFDTSHGFAHRDLIDGRGRKKKTPMFVKDFNEALIFAEADIKSNWKMYKEQFIKEYEK